MTSATRPSLLTMVGAIELAMRLPGSTELMPICEKAPIALPSRMPVPGITILDPNPADCVVVHETALPCASTTEKWVVCGDSDGAISDVDAISPAGVARSGSIGGLRLER